MRRLCRSELENLFQDLTNPFAVRTVDIGYIVWNPVKWVPKFIFFSLLGTARVHQCPQTQLLKTRDLCLKYVFQRSMPNWIDLSIFSFRYIDIDIVYRTIFIHRYIDIFYPIWHLYTICCQSRVEGRRKGGGGGGGAVARLSTAILCVWMNCLFYF